MAAQETLVKNAFGLLMVWETHPRRHMGRAQTRLIKCRHCMLHHHCFLCAYIIYTSKGGGEGRGLSAKLQGAHVQLRLAMWGDK